MRLGVAYFIITNFFLLFGGFAAELKIEVFYRGLLAEDPGEWAELMVLAPKDSGFPFDLKIADAPGLIPAQPGLSFGSLVKVGNIPNEVTTLEIQQVLRHPPMTLPDGRTSTQRVERLSLPVSLNTATMVMDFAFQEAHELVAGNWILEGYLEDGTLFYRQRFRIVKGAQSPALPELGAAEAEAMFAMVRNRVRSAHALDAEDGSFPDAVWACLEPALNRDWGRFRAAINDAQQNQSGNAQALDSSASVLPIWIEDMVGLDRTIRQPGGAVALELARDTMRALPPKALVFGGTDFGRFVLEAARLLEDREDIILICQHQLVQKPYREWVASRSAEALAFPGEDDTAKLMLDYAKEIVPEEALGAGGLEFVGYSHMVEIASRLSQRLIELNPERPVFIEESFPMPWMRERMRPGLGLLLEVGDEPLSSWSKEQLTEDNETWAEHILAVSGMGTRTSVQASLLQMRAVTRDILEGHGQAKAVERVQQDLVRLCDPVSGELFGLIPKGVAKTENRLQTYGLRRHKRLP